MIKYSILPPLSSKVVDVCYVNFNETAAKDPGGSAGEPPFLF